MTGAASGQSYPSRPVRIVTGESGGGNDIAARLISPGLSARLGQSVIVDNRPAGVIPGQIVATATPDGYTLLLAASILWIGPLLEKTPYDPVRDFAPLSLLVRTPTVLTLHPSMPANSVQDLIAMANAKPGALNYASAGNGGIIQLSAELFKAMAGVNITAIPYKGGGPALNAVISGEVQVIFATAGAVLPLMKSGRIKTLAITSAAPSTLFPGLPTVASSGLPGYESVSIIGMFAPPKTPAVIVTRLSRDLAEALKTPAVREKFLSTGIETVGSTPDELARTMKSEIARLGKVIRDAGIKGD
jgi:tripartite-type tricarboxylate transporter receptor subunit TctC